MTPASQTDYIVCDPYTAKPQVFPVAAAWSNAVVEASLRPDGRKLSEVPYVRVSGSEVSTSRREIICIARLKALQGSVP